MKKMTSNLTITAIVAASIAATAAVASEQWPADVPGFVPPKPGEHPRLLFRKSDVPALRQKAQTPEGKAIIARLRFVLGNNGEMLPENVSPATKGYPGPGKYQSLSIDDQGYLTLGHPAGYGLLYQLTGDKKYALLGQQAFEAMLKGVRDVDSRYSLVWPNGELRSGSSWAIAALGYDLCYDGWDQAFRVKMAQALLNAKGEGGQFGLEKVVTKPKYDPAKNHYGGIACGAMAAAALLGDPGTEGTDIQKWMPAAFQNTKRMFTGGFGDHGFYSEGHGPSHVSSDTGMLPWIQAAKIACGKDFITPAPNAQWVTLRWVMELVPTKNGCQYPDRKGASSSYGTDDFWRGNWWSHGGQFAQGFGAVDPKYVPAMLWVYENFVQDCESKNQWSKNDQDIITKGWLKPGEKSYDVIKSPWKGVMAFVSWPVGVKSENPVTMLSHSVEDRVHGYYVFRNQWKDENDILVTALLGYGPKSAYKPQYGPIYLWALGKKMSFGNFRSTVPADYTPTAHGGVVSTGTQCLAVDFSGASGAPALIALTGIEGPRDGGMVKVTPVEVGGQTITIVTVQNANAPAVNGTGDKVVVGGQTINWDGKKISFAK